MCSIPSFNSQEHSSDKDTSESKRKKDSPVQPPVDAAEIKVRICTVPFLRGA